MTSQIRRERSDELASMLRHPELAGAIAFVSSPSTWQPAIVDPNGSLISHAGDAIDTTKTFAVEGFHPRSRVNFRWTLTREGGSGWIIEVVDGHPTLEHIDTKYYLWGKVTEKREGWARLYEARVGSIWIPAAENRAPIGSFITLHRTEYVEPSPDGLAVVVEELIVGLSSVTTTNNED